jgi:hypothetical protein
MAEQGSYPLNGRQLAGTDTATGVVTGQTADIPLSALAAFVLNGGGISVVSGPTSSRPAPVFVGQFFFDTTLGFGVWASSLSPIIWVDAAGVSV